MIVAVTLFYRPWDGEQELFTTSDLGLPRRLSRWTSPSAPAGTAARKKMPARRRRNAAGGNTAHAGAIQCGVTVQRDKGSSTASPRAVKRY